MSCLASRGSSPSEPKVNLLSLPEELLYSIFYEVGHPGIWDNLADELLRDPLCKTLHPHVQRNLYREVHISSTGTFQRFFSTIRHNPSLAHLVRHLYIGNAEAGSELRPLETLLYEFARLRRPGPILQPSLADYLPRLTSLEYGCDVLRPQETVQLSKLQHLVKLDLAFKQSAFDDSAPTDPPPRLARLKTLKLSAIYSVLPENPWNSATDAFVNLCPSLSHLLLEDSVGFLRYRKLLRRIDDEVATSLTSLSLLANEDDHARPAPSDHLLPRFRNLQELVIEGGNVSSALANHLRELPRLRVLEVGVNTEWYGPSLKDFTSLVSGPTRIDTLTEFKLDYFLADMRETVKRVDIGDTVRDESEGYGMMEDGWYPFNLETVSDLEDLFDAAEENGVRLRGYAINFMLECKDYKVEEANRLILRAHQTKSLDEYVRVLAEDDWAELPELDVDNLDISRCKVVKVNCTGANTLNLGTYELTLEQEE
ncbi:hypothetical protein JCM16303_000079 [Sporobolomyces ruberrimus]